jgi:hypothetical protein
VAAQAVMFRVKLCCLLFLLIGDALGGLGCRTGLAREPEGAPAPGAEA